MTEYQAYTKETYEWALRNSIVRNQTEFANAVGMSKSTLSGILKGDARLSGKQTAKNVKAWKEKHYPSVGASNVVDFNKGYRAALKEMDQFDWESFKRETAKSLLSAQIMNANIYSDDANMVYQAQLAVRYAQILVDELKKV